MMTCRRGDVVEASGPFTERESGRPFLIVRHPSPTLEVFDFV